MKISALRLHNVKRFAGRSVAIEGIGDGVNVLCAANEFGKSTSFEALHALFFVPYSSKGKDATALRPYSGGSPLIEADVETRQGRYRLTKQFLTGASAQVFDLEAGRLIAQADEAESFLNDLIRGGANGPAGMLWVRQGATGIEKRSKNEEDSERQVRETLLQSVQGEVEAVTGGRRMDEILRGVTGELDVLVTKRGPKAGGPYAAAIAERDRLAEEEAKLSEQVRQLRAALDERAALQKRLAELNDADAAVERTQALEKAQAALKTAQEQAQRLQAAKTTFELARERHSHAAQKYASFLAAREQLHALQDELNTLTTKRDDARERRDQLRQSIEETQGTASAAEQVEKEARDMLARIARQQKAREAAERLAELTAKLEKAEAARQAIDGHNALFIQLNMGEKPLHQLAQLDVEIATLSRLLKDARPSVQIAYDSSATSKILMAGAPLLDGQAYDYAGRAELYAEGIGTILLQSNFEEDDSRLAQLQAQRSQILASMGVTDLAAARAQQERANGHKAEVKQNEIRLTAWAPNGIPALRDEIAACQLNAADLLEDEIPLDPSEPTQALEQALEQRRQASEKLRSLAPARARAEEDLQSASSRLAELAATINQLLDVCGPPDQQEANRKAQADALEPLAQELARAEEAVSKLSAENVDLASAEASFNRAKSVVKAAEEAIQNAQLALAHLNGQIRKDAGDAVEEVWLETKDALAGAQSRVESYEREVAVLRCLASTLEEARSKARDLYLKPVMEELKPLLGLLFDDATIQFDEKTLLPEKLVRNGLEEDVDRLSGGMREQLSVLTRLAFARLLTKDERPAPVILDDALVYSDDDRIEKMFDALHRQAQGQQIIVFSCRQRAFQKLGGNVLQPAEWQR